MPQFMDGDKVKCPFKDIWILGPGTSSCRGSFPKGLISRVKKRWWGKNRCWLFSGGFSYNGDVTVDIRPEMEPTHVLDCSELPDEWTDRFDFTFADPPYSEQEAKELYDLPYVSIVKALNEQARITAPGGYMLFLHRLVPFRQPAFNEHMEQCEMIALVGIAVISMTCNMRALTVWRKRAAQKIDEYNDSNKEE